MIEISTLGIFQWSPYLGTSLGSSDIGGILRLRYGESQEQYLGYGTYAELKSYRMHKVLPIFLS